MIHTLSKMLAVSAVLGLSMTCTLSAQTEQPEALCPSGIPETAKEEDFVLMPGGETYHIASNLIFMRCSLGQTWDGNTCLSEPSVYSWQEALQISQATTFNDSTNWRLPNLKELSVITERACVRPSINDTIFPNTSPDDYWTSTPSLFDEAGAWSIAFTNGSNSVKLKDRNLFVRLVRTRLPDESLIE